MLYVMLRQSIYWANEVLYASTVSGIPDDSEGAREFWRAWCGDGPISAMPELTVKVTADGPFPDSYWFISLMHLYSDRLVEILRQFNIKFQCFPVQLVDRITGTAVPRSYSAFRFLATYPCIDYDHSIIEKDPWTDIWKLVLNPDCVESADAMFELEKFGGFRIVKAELKAALDQANITGFKYVPVDEFQIGMKVYFAQLKAQKP